MKTVIVNGSPRGKQSNSRLLTDQFLAGLGKIHLSAENKTYYLVNRHQTQDVIDDCLQADVILMVFPLYTDAMPAIVKQFFEKMPSLKGKRIGYLVQSGFPESIHCQYLEQYLGVFTRKLGAVYLGTVSRGNVEGIQDRPAWMNKKLYANYFRLGEHFGTTGAFNPTIVSDLKKPYRLPAFTRAACSLFLKAGFSDIGWNRQLKMNHAYAQRNARPYEMKLSAAVSGGTSR